MARGFGSTLGAGATDSVASAFSEVVSTGRSYHVMTSRNGAGGGNFGRFWDAGPTVDYAFNSDAAGVYQFNRAWSGAPGGVASWTCPRPSTGTWVGFGLSYDGGSVANDPVMYVAGASQAVTEIGTPSGTISNTGSAYRIGNRPAGDRNWDGLLAEFAVWDAILTADEFGALGRGCSPLLIRPRSLVEYLPLLRSNMSGRRAAPTVTGTAVRPHPRIAMPGRRLLIVPAAGGGTQTVAAAGVSCAVQIGDAAIVADETAAVTGVVTAGAVGTAMVPAAGVAEVSGCGAEGWIGAISLRFDATALPSSALLVAGTGIPWIRRSGWSPEGSTAAGWTVSSEPGGAWTAASPVGNGWSAAVPATDSWAGTQETNGGWV